MDRSALSTIEQLNPAELYEKVKSGQCAMDAVGPVSTIMMTAKVLGAKKVNVLKYANSGDVTGDKAGRIVGYASIIFYSKD